MLLDSLNEQQRQAASILSGPVFVFAGAGSGKTRTLTYRIANMIENGIDPKTILAITFTNKATNEMRERLYSLVGIEAHSLTISTFHSLCAMILRREITVLGYAKDFMIIDDDDQLTIISQVLQDLNIDKKVYSSKYIRKVINHCKSFDIKPIIKLEETIIYEYEKTMKSLNRLDFEDLLIKVREIFSIYPEILNKYQQKYQNILVDEFQDTDIIQYQIIKMLAQKNRNIFVVGDDDQAIYSFRGANYQNMSDFKKDFKECQKIVLNQNYRSTQSILEGCNSLISNNEEREPKKLFSNIKGNNNDVIINQLNNEIDEVNFVTNEIKNLLREGYKQKDIAILYRTSSILRNFEIGMNQASLKYRVFGGMSFFARREIKDMVSYLHFILYPNDFLNFKRIVNIPSRGIGVKTVDNIVNFAKTNKITIFDAIEELKDELKSKYKILFDFKEMINYFKTKIDEISLQELYEEILSKTNYIEMLEDEEDGKDRIDNVLEFKSVLYNLDNNGEIKSNKDKLIDAFDDAILVSEKLQNYRYDNDGITLSTVHCAKGLEFKVVFIVAFEMGIFPIIRLDDPPSIEEERRIAYVACTRAKEKLYLSCVASRLLFGQRQIRKQSKFLLEFRKANDIHVNHQEAIKEKFEQEKTTTEYRVGDMVIHSSFGEGMVVSLNGDIGKICFTTQGVIKTFDMTHPAIRKK